VSRSARVAVKTAVWIVALTPLAWLGWRAWTSDLTANPINFLTDELGLTALRLLLVTLALTPLRILFGWGWQMTLRRLLGLLTFFYVALHFLVWLVLDHFFDWREMTADILKRPFITVGFLAFVSLLPLAATSTARMVKRLGAVRWRRLHRLVYAAAALATLHYLWVGKLIFVNAAAYALGLGVVLAIRGADALRRRRRRRQEARTVAEHDLLGSAR